MGIFGMGTTYRSWKSMSDVILESKMATSGLWITVKYPAICVFWERGRLIEAWNRCLTLFKNPRWRLPVYENCEIPTIWVFLKRARLVKVRNQCWTPFWNSIWRLPVCEKLSKTQGVSHWYRTQWISIGLQSIKANNFDFLDLVELPINFATRLLRQCHRFRSCHAGFFTKGTSINNVMTFFTRRKSWTLLF